MYSDSICTGTTKLTEEAQVSLSFSPGKDILFSEYSISDFLITIQLLTFSLEASATQTLASEQSDEQNYSWVDFLLLCIMVFKENASG